jgi:hypothetical protein
MILRDLRWFIPLFVCILGVLMPLGYGTGGDAGIVATLTAAVIVGGGQILSGRHAASRAEISWKQVFSASLFSELLGGLIKGISGVRDGSVHFSIIDGFLMVFMLTFNAGCAT